MMCSKMSRAGGPHHQVHLATEPPPLFKEHNLVAALGGDARGFTPGRPATDDDDIPLVRCRL